MTSRSTGQPSSKASKKRNLNNALRHDQEEWKSGSKSMANTLKGIIRDHGRIVCVIQSGDVMICV